jgi:alpha-beta hydrolase superfamily lysophospholipase
VYRASDGYLLQYRHWPAATSTPRAHIVALHGIQSHSGWYTYSSTRLAQAGYEVYFLDRRGSGLNPLDRGHVLHEDRLINDVVQFLLDLEHRRAQAGITAPVILMGVSWGGKLATAVALRRPDLCSALALLYPGIYSRARPSWWQRASLQWAEFVGWGRGLLPIPLNDPELFTNESRWQEFIHRDELALVRVSISFLLANFRLTDEIDDRIDALSLPTLLMLAGRDDIIDNETTKERLAAPSHPERTLIEYPAARHTLEFEPDPEPFIADLLSWLSSAVLNPDSPPAPGTSRR